MEGEINMDCDLYRKQLNRAVHWRIPEADANEILTDYDEMLSQCPDGRYDTFVEKFGKPAQVARMLTQPKDYYRWLAVFCFLVTCLLVPEVLLLLVCFGQLSTQFLYLVFLLGFVVSLIWFNSHRGIKFCGSRHKRLLVSLLILLGVTASTGVFLASLFAQKWNIIPAKQYGSLAYLVLLLTGTVSASFGVYGLVQARLSADRRWCALYVLGLAVLIMCAVLLSMLTAVVIEQFSTLPLYLAILCVGGILGMGVFLC